MIGFIWIHGINYVLDGISNVIPIINLEFSTSVCYLLYTEIIYQTLHYHRKHSPIYISS